MATRIVNGGEGWTLRKAPRSKPQARRRRGASAAGSASAGDKADFPPAFLQSSSLRVEDVFEATPSAAGARRGAVPELVLEVDLKPGEASILAVRHPSGALSFHQSTGQIASVPRRGRATPKGSTRRSAPAGSAVFRITVRRVESAAGSGRRGVISKALKVIVLKVVKPVLGKAVSAALPRLAALWEKQTWSQRNLREGWFRVSPGGGQAPGLRLAPGVPKPGERSLLLLHGTFSHAQGAFAALAGTDFFERVRPLYGDRIYAYNHFTLSRAPLENAQQLLKALPAGEHTFDAITHSRGGLVLRSLVEQGRKLGAPAERFRLGHAVLVASPNDGTPLATPTRWEDTVGWLANLMEVFPDNPFTTGAEFISEALVWLASHVSGDLPGLRAMDGAGELIGDLQSPPGPPTGSYSALVSNYHPDDALWQRALDVGVDQFFGSANDLVVPSEGGWRIDRDGSSHIPPSRIGCYGPGGNIDTGGKSVVNHVGFFQRRETATFLAKALAREPQGLAAIDANAPLPDRRFKRAARMPGAPAAGALAVSAPTAMAGTAPPPAPVAAPAAAAVLGEILRRQDDVDTFHIVIMDTFEGPGGARGRKRRLQGGEQLPEEPVDNQRGAMFARVLAAYGGARVMATMRLRAEKGGPRTHFGQIIAFHERIKNYTNRVQGTLPSDDKMIEFGGLLFETLFQGDVRRLYDEARSRQRGRKLDLVLTSMIPWIAEKPWEFSYDTGRASFLATEEIHFVRNVLTAIPAEPIIPCQGPLRILVASAQPVGFGHLSVDQELEVIRRGFDALIEAGLAVVDVLPRATPAAIHGHISTGSYNVVHFIGHGVFDEEKQEGCLMFEDTRGGVFPLGQRSVREIFCQRGVSLVFLNACQSGAGGRSDFNKGVAQALVAHGLPALVANQYSVLDSSATSFAQHFYWSLAQGSTLGEAAREARIAVNYSLQGELIDWAVPVLYARDANRVLCAKPATVLKVQTTSVRSTSRRATAGRATRVAVWDIDHVFPALERTLQRMNEAQGAFGFELVDMSAPLDIWELQKTDDGTPYLWAERLAKRLQSKPVELRVNLLTCVTRHWLRSDDWLNIYGWWPPRKEPHVAIFSCAGFDDLQPEGPGTDRAIANTMVGALAGFFGELDTHEHGAKDCPLSMNMDREVKHLAGAQKFDAGCRKKLGKTMSRQLPALEALLKVFAAG